MYPWGDNRRFNSYAAYFRRTFGHRIQKVAVNAGFTCPNRDGTVGRGGCTFCDNAAFTPSYCTPAKSVTQQIDEGIEFHRRRYRTAGSFLVYFQSFSNTYAPLADLRRLYDEALAHPDVAGIVIGTRPDCVDEAKLDYFASLARDRYVAIEYGVESTSDATLRRINRGHDFATARRAIRMTAERGIQFHQLQLFRGTPLAAEYDAAPERFRFWSVEEYIDLFIEILRRLRPDIVVERFAGEAPPRFHHTEGWGLIRNETLLSMLDHRLEELDVRQGDMYHPRTAANGVPLSDINGRGVTNFNASEK